MDNVEGEYESKVSELQSDVADLKRALDEQQNNVKMAERQKSSIITQLTEQNQRLTAQLKEVLNWIKLYIQFNLKEIRFKVYGNVKQNFNAMFPNSSTHPHSKPVFFSLDGGDIGSTFPFS